MVLPNPASKRQMAFMVHQQVAVFLDELIDNQAASFVAIFDIATNGFNDF